MILLLRVFAPAAGPAEAEVIGRRLLDALQEFTPVTAQPPERYWKIPEWFEHAVRLTPANEAGFEAVLALAALGWDPVVRDVECSAVWNRVPGGEFLRPEVTWAELLLIHAPDRPGTPPLG